MNASKTVLLARVRTMRLVILGAAALLVWVTPANWLQRLEGVLIDVYVALRATDAPDPRVALIDIDEASLGKLGPWPWPRTLLADLVERLIAQHGVKGIALDVVLPEPADPAGDARLAALAEHGPVTLAVAFDLTTRHPPLLYGHPGQGGRYPQHPPAREASGYLGNHSGLAKARCVGNIGFVPDSDGALRRLPLRVRFQGRDYLTLSAALLICTEALRFDTLSTLPLDDQGLWPLRFQRRLSAYTTISAADLLNERLPPGLLQNRYVIVGSSAVGLADRVATPLSTLTSGFAVHAVALDELLGHLEAPEHSTPPDAVLIGAWLLGLTLILVTLPRRSLAPVWIAMALLLPLIALLIAGALWPILKVHVLARLTGLHSVCLIAVVAYEWWRSHRETQKVVDILTHYVAPAVVDEILRHPQFRPLEPRHHEITVMVVDMAGYTALTGQLPLDQAAQLTREFLKLLTEPVLASGGTLDRYSGDGLVAFWGAPLPHADHAQRALQTARLILQSVEAWQPSFGLAEHHLPIRVRLGMESGHALVGDLGTEFRSTYTAVGECINLAAKLESAARGRSPPIVIGPRMAELCRRANVPLQSLGTIHVGDMALEGFTLPANWGDRHVPVGI